MLSKIPAIHTSHNGLLMVTVETRAYIFKDFCIGLSVGHANHRLIVPAHSGTGSNGRAEVFHDLRSSLLCSHAVTDPVAVNSIQCVGYILANPAPVLLGVSVDCISLKAVCASLNLQHTR